MRPAFTAAFSLGLSLIGLTGGAHADPPTIPKILYDNAQCYDKASENRDLSALGIVLSCPTTPAALKLCEDYTRSGQCFVQALQFAQEMINGRHLADSLIAGIPNAK